MVKKVNPLHQDKLADRISGASVDLAYMRVENPRIAVEVLIGHHIATIIIESNVTFTNSDVVVVVSCITGRNDIKVSLVMVQQDPILSSNQDGEIRFGDN